MQQFSLSHAQKNMQQVEQKWFIFYDLFMMFPVILLFKILCTAVCSFFVTVSVVVFIMQYFLPNIRTGF